MAFTYAGYYENTAVSDATPPTLVRSTVVNVYLPNTTTSATLYNGQDKQGTVPSITTDSTGFFSFFAEPGFYDVKIGDKTRRVKVDEDPGDTVSPDQRNVANGFAGLDGSGTLPTSIAPAAGWPKTALATTVQTTLTKADSAAATANSAMSTANGLSQIISWLGEAAVNVPAISIGGTQTITVNWPTTAPTTDYSVTCSLIVPAASITLLGTLRATPIMSSRTTMTCQFAVKNSGLASISAGTVTLNAIGARGYRPSA